MTAAIAAIPRSSTMVTVVMGRLKAVPMQAHLSFSPRVTANTTPTDEKAMSPKVARCKFGLPGMAK